MGNYSARFGGGHLEKGRNAPRQVSTLQRYPYKGEHTMPKEQPYTADMMKKIADFDPKIIELNNQVLFGDIWERPGLSKRDRSLITVAALVALYRTNELPSHLLRARENGVSLDELAEVFTHLAFYAGWPNALTAIRTAIEYLDETDQA